MIARPKAPRPADPNGRAGTCHKAPAGKRQDRCQIPIRRRKPRLAFFGQPLAARVNASYTRVGTAKPCYEKSQLTAVRSGKNSPPVLSPVAFPQPLLDTRAFDRRASETWPCLLACRVEALLMQKEVDIERAKLGQERPRSLRLRRQAITA
jgi:hypothetical protein